MCALPTPAKQTRHKGVSDSNKLDPLPTRSSKNYSLLRLPEVVYRTKKNQTVRLFSCFTSKIWVEWMHLFCVFYLFVHYFVRWSMYQVVFFCLRTCLVFFTLYSYIIRFLINLFIHYLFSPKVSSSSFTSSSSCSSSLRLYFGMIQTASVQLLQNISCASCLLV